MKIALELLHEVVDRVMAAEVDGLTGAVHGERTPARKKA